MQPHIQAIFTGNLLDPVNLAIMTATGGYGKAHAAVAFTAHKHEFLNWLEEELIQLYAEGLNEVAERVEQLITTALDVVVPWPEGHCRVYFESIGKRDKLSGKTGVRGPYDLRRVCAWQAKHPKVRRLELVNLPDVRPEEVPRAFRRCCRAVPTVKYAFLQLVQNWKGVRLKLGIAPRRRSPDHWHCVETFVRVMREWALRNARLGDVLFDEYVPAGKRGFGLYDMIGEAGK